MAGRTVRATYRNGMLLILDPVELKEGETITLTLHEEEEEEKARRREQVLRESFGAWKGLIDPDAFIRGIYESRSVQTRPEPKFP
jgi:predicted DNA-binding antitoxin AbrB/MazE fold protein